MLAAAALCPAPPLLIPELTGAAEVAADLRAACLAAVAELTGSDPDIIVIVGASRDTRTWPAGSRLNLATFAPGRAGAGATAGRDPGPAGLPATVGVGAWLLDQAGFTGERLLQSVAGDESASGCARLGAELVGQHGLVGLLVMADGSTRRGLKAPGYLDERSESFDAEVERAVRDGDLRALLAIDAGLASELMAEGRAAWQVLAGAVSTIDGQIRTQVRYSGDPFGVAYLAASVRVEE